MIIYTKYLKHNLLPIPNPYFLTHENPQQLMTIFISCPTFRFPTKMSENLSMT